MASKGQAENQRKESRAPLTRRGTVSDGTKTLTCLLQDFSSNGFSVLVNEALPLGQVLELKCELYPAKVLSCTIEVRHVVDTCHGTKIVGITAPGIALLKQFLEEYYSLKLNFGT
jgi:PilZ domain-containing protein